MNKPQLTASEVLRLLNSRFSPGREVEFLDGNDLRGPLHIRTSAGHGATVEEVQAYLCELGEKYDLVPDPTWREQLAARKSQVGQELQYLEAQPPSAEEDEFTYSVRLEGAKSELDLIKKTQTEWNWAE